MGFSRGWGSPSLLTGTSPGQSTPLDRMWLGLRKDPDWSFNHVDLSGTLHWHLGSKCLWSFCLVGIDMNDIA